MMSTEWKLHPTNKYTWITPTGEVWKRVNASHPERRQWVRRTPEIDKDGYLRITVETKHYLVHRLVYELFVAPLIGGMVICHLDGVRTNNTPGNLLQASQKENISHKIAHGTHQAGETHPRAKISSEEARAVLRKIATARFLDNGQMGRGEHIRISRETGVSVHIVRDIHNKGSWANAIFGL